MRIRRMLLVLGVLAAGSAPAAGEPWVEEFILAGSDHAVWLLREDPGDGRFDLAVRKTDGAWQWAHKGVSGNPVGAVATASQLHVIFASPAGHVIFDAETGRSTTALRADHALWPAGEAPLAVCEAVDPNGGAGGEILAVVARRARGPATATAPASRPTLAGGGAFHLGLFRRIGSQWTHLADWRDVSLGPASRVLAAATGRGVHVLVSGAAGRANRLRCWDGQAWRDVALAGPASEETPVGLLSIPDGSPGAVRRLVLLSAGPAAQGARRELAVTTFDEGAEAPVRQTMIGGDGAAATWSADALPVVARLARQVALIWRTGETLRFGTCVPHVGRLTVVGDVDVFSRPPPDDGGGEVLSGFMWVVLLAAFVPMLLFRPRGGAQPFFLPETVQRGNLGKRLVAVIIDLVPIYVLISAGYMFSPSAMTEEQMSRMLQRMLDQEKVQVPVGLAVAYVSVLVIYVTYCTVMEARTGTTVGKRLMKLAVVGSGGVRADLRQCLLRNLMKVIELLSLTSPLFFLVLLVPMFTRYRQRFGDLIARTAVVDARTAIPEDSTSEGDEPPAGP